MEVHAEDLWLICCGLLSIAFLSFTHIFADGCVNGWWAMKKRGRAESEWIWKPSWRGLQL